MWRVRVGMSRCCMYVVLCAWHRGIIPVFIQEPNPKLTEQPRHNHKKISHRPNFSPLTNQTQTRKSSAVPVPICIQPQTPQEKNVSRRSTAMQPDEPTFLTRALHSPPQVRFLLPFSSVQVLPSTATKGPCKLRAEHIQKDGVRPLISCS